MLGLVERRGQGEVGEGVVRSRAHGRPALLDGRVRLVLLHEAEREQGVRVRVMGIVGQGETELVRGPVVAGVDVEEGGSLVAAGHR